MDHRSLSRIFLLFLLFLPLGCTKNKSATSPGSGLWVQATAHAPFAGRYGLSGTIFNNQMWVVGGASGPVTTYYGDVWSSSNGSTWTPQNSSPPFGGRYGSQVLSYSGMLWLIGGNNSGTLRNDVWNSSDGITWTRVLAPSTGSATQFTPREDFAALVYNGSMWVIGGFSNTSNNNDVWNSTNGVTWNQVLANGTGSATQFRKRWGMAAAVYNNQMWIFGGASGPNTGAVSAVYADVWNSSTGATWSNLGINSLLNPYYYEQVVVNNNTFWMTGGFMGLGWGSQSEYDQSTTGMNWADGTNAFPHRFYHLSLNYNNQVWVIGGCDDYCDTVPCGPITYLNDVWHTQ